MKHLFTAAALLVLVSGCYYTEIASGGSSPEMQEWEKMILESYPGHVPPKTTNRSYRGNKAETRYSTVKVDKLKPMDDLDPRPAAQEQTEVKELSEPKAEEPAIKEVKPEGEPKAEEPAIKEVKPEGEPKAEEPAVKEVKPEGEPKAEEPKAEEPKNDAPKAEEPKAEEPKNDAPKAEEPKVPAADDKNAPPDPTNSTVYEVKGGDTLGSIAHKVYGNARYSNIIFRANTDILKDANKLRPGMKLIVPKL